MRVFIEKNHVLSEHNKITQATVWNFRRFLEHRLRQATHQFCTIFAFQEMKIQFNQEDLYQEVLD